MPLLEILIAIQIGRKNIRNPLRRGLIYCYRERRKEFMPKRFVINVGGTQAIAELLEQEAPTLSRCFWDNLPVDSFSVHAKFAGQEMIVMVLFYSITDLCRGGRPSGGGRDMVKSIVLAVKVGEQFGEGFRGRSSALLKRVYKKPTRPPGCFFV